jgi:hypothetical protein
MEYTLTIEETEPRFGHDMLKATAICKKCGHMATAIAGDSMSVLEELGLDIDHECE